MEEITMEGLQKYADFVHIDALDEGESEQKYFDRVLDAYASLPDDDWADLPEDIQAWYNDCETKRQEEMKAKKDELKPKKVKEAKPKPEKPKAKKTKVDEPKVLKEEESEDPKEEVSLEKTDRANVVRKQISDCKEAVEKNFLEMAKMLSEAYHGRYHEIWGFESFEVYCNTELDVHYRKAIDLVHIWDKAIEFKLPQKKIELIGWSKMKEVAAIMNEKNSSDLIEKAEQQSARELEETVRAMKDKKKKSTSIDVEDYVTIILKMTQKEASTVERAIEKAKKKYDLENIVSAVERICKDWLAIK